MKPVFVRGAYNYDGDVVSAADGLECKDVSLAKQSFAEESDINFIVQRFGLTGELPQNLQVPEYGDFEQVMDYQGALNMVRAAGEAFMELPANVRARFGNDPGALVDFVSDPANLDEARKLGIAVPQKVGAPVSAPAPDVSGPSPEVGTAST